MFHEVSFVNPFICDCEPFTKIGDLLFSTLFILKGITVFIGPLIIFLSQGWRNVPAHIKLHADRASDPPGELHPRRTPAGGGKVLRASWSVQANKKRSSHPPLANIYTPQNLCHIWRGSAQGLPLGSAQPQMGLQALPTKTMLPPRPRGRDR